MQKQNLFVDALFPDGVVCALCNQEAVVGNDGMCCACRAAIVRCPRTLNAPDGLDGLTAGLIYNEATEAAVHRFKYQRQVWLAPFFAGFIELPAGWRIDCLTPVPLHPLRRWLRTFNQSERLASALQARYPIPIRSDLLRRTRYTAPQARLDAARRAVNLTGAFSANARVAGLSVLLIDDVTTTHNTLQNCAAALRHAGAKRVYAACACLAGLDGAAYTQGIAAR